MWTQWPYLSSEKWLESIAWFSSASDSLGLITGNWTFILYYYLLLLFECDFRAYPDLAELELGLGLAIIVLKPKKNKKIKKIKIKIKINK